MPLISRDSTTLSVAIALGLWLTVTPSAQRGGGGQQPNPAVEPMRFRYMGPPSAGRISAVAGIPGDTMTYYLGAASGGVWKSTDGGATFAPIFDDQPVQAIGALAVAPSDPNIVWAGTGEAWAIRDATSWATASTNPTDAGATWTNMGLRETGRIGRIIVHPTQSEHRLRLRAGPGDRTAAGARRLSRRPTAARRGSACCSSTRTPAARASSMDANDPNVLYRRHVAGRDAHLGDVQRRPGSGVYMTRDGGATWKQGSSTGLPKSPVGKIDVAVAPSDSKRVYALIQTANQGSLWRSDDGGATWRVVSWDRTLIGRAGYYIRSTSTRRTPTRCWSRTAASIARIDGGTDVPDQGRRLRRLPRHLDGSEEPDHWVATGDGGTGITPITADVQPDRRCRSARCITSPSTTRCRTGSTATGRTTARCAGRARFAGARCRERAGVVDGRRRAGVRRQARGRDDAAEPRRTRRAAAAADAGGSAAEHAVETRDIGGCESGFTLPDLDESRHRLGELLRQRSHALRRADAARAVGQPVDPHARLAAEQD